MDLSTVYSKTAKGLQAITQKGKRLPAGHARALSLVDGRATVGEILEKTGEPPTSTLPQVLADLSKDGYLKAVTREPLTEFSITPDTSASMVVSETVDETFFKVLAETEARKKLMREAAANPQEARQKVQEKAAAMAEEEAMRRKNEAREAAEAEERSRQIAAQRKIAETMALEAAAIKAHREAESQALWEMAEKARAEAEERLRKEPREGAAKKANFRAAAERKAQEEAAAKARAKLSKQLKMEARAKEEAERNKAREREKAEARAKAEAEAEAEEEARAEARKQLRLEARAREEAELNKARKEAEERMRLEAEAENHAREEAERQARAEEEARAKAEANAKAREEAERKAREDEEAREKRAAEVRAIVEAEEKERAEEAAQIKAEAEAKAQEEAERKAREEAEARAKAEAEARARREAEEKIRAQEEALAQARADAERKAREEAEQEERERSEIEARARALVDARAEEAEKTRQKALAKPRKFQRPVKLGQAALISLAALILLPLVLLQVMSLNVFTPPIEELASDRMREPVSIQSMRASLWPAPHLRLEGVTISKLRDIKIPTVRVMPELAAFFGETRTVKSIEVESLAIDQDALARAMDWFGPGGSAEKIQVRRIAIKTATIDVKGIPLPPLEVDVALAATGKLEQAKIRSTDKKIEVAITPENGGFEIKIAANDWQPPLWPNLTFTELHAKAMATLGGMRFSEIEGRLYSGKAKGSATVKWGDFWSAEGDLDIENILLAGAMPALTDDMELSGKLDAKAVYSMQARNLGTLFDNPGIKASFNVRDGSIGNIDLARAIQPRATETTGGKTRFASLAGSMTLDGRRYQYRQMKLAAGLLTASGEADIMPNKQLSGKTSVEMKLKSSTVRANLTLSGDLKQPVLRR